MRDNLPYLVVYGPPLLFGALVIGALAWATMRRGI